MVMTTPSIVARSSCHVVIQHSVTKCALRSQFLLGQGIQRVAKLEACLSDALHTFLTRLFFFNDLEWPDRWRALYTSP